MKPKITVVIPTFNREKEIQTAIKSVQKQTFRNWKALIIDDGSTDNTRQIIKKLIKKDPRFSYYRMPKNRGICRVLNKALQLVDTKYMVQVDSDDWLERDALYKLLSKMEKDEDAALAYGNHKERRAGKRSTLFTQRDFNPSDKYKLLCYPHMVYPRFYRTSCLRDVGGWDIHDKYNGRFMEDRRVLFKLIEKYKFVWVNKHLYNLRRSSQQRLTARENRRKYRELKKTLIQKTIEKWGDEYRAKFHRLKGWNYRIELIPNQR